MRPDPAVLAVVFLGLALAGCLDDEPKSLFLPAVTPGDEAQYHVQESGESIHLQMVERTRILTADLKAQVADVMMVTHGSDAGERQFIYRSDLLPAVGYGFASGPDAVVYQPVSGMTHPSAHLALFPFHGYGGRTLSLGETALVPSQWLSEPEGRGDCVLTITRVYSEYGGTRAEAMCEGSDQRVRFVFSEGNPFPIEVETRRGVYVLTSVQVAGDTDKEDMEDEDMILTSGPYGRDGPVDGAGAAFSLADATSEVREGFRGRPARQCLEDRPDALLRQAALFIQPDGHEWALRWSSSSGDCTARVDTRSTSDEVGISDRSTDSSNWPAPPDMPLEALTISDAFALWHYVLDDGPDHFQIKLDSDGTIQYALYGGDHYLSLDAQDLRLGHMEMPIPNA